MRTIFHEPVYVVDAKRTPFGAFLGSLSRYTATDLGVLCAQACLRSSAIAPELIGHVIFGNVLQTSKDAIYLARHIGLRAGILAAIPAVTVNRLCGSGFEAIIQGARLISNKEAQCVLVGGTESMSQAPHIIRGARVGLSLGQSMLEDSLWECLFDTYANMPMGITAENLAELYHISQDEVDDYSVMSQHRYQRALLNNGFSDEITPIAYESKQGTVTIAVDEHPRKNASHEALKKLPKVFKKDGVIHAGAASGICDGAAALILCNETCLVKHQLTPLSEILSFGVTGCDPKIMGIGPVDAIKQCLNKVSVSLDHVAMVEVNEAFAPQVLAVKKALDLNMDRLNIDGGAIAIGHPLGASGARIAAHLVHSLKKSPQSLGVGSACIGGGQGIAILVRSM